MYDLIVKINAHGDRDVSGRREGRILADKTPLSHPIPRTVPPFVYVKFNDGKQAERVELMPVSALSITAKLKGKGTHIIVKGDLIGTIVNHIRTERGMARVFAEGTHRLEAFTIEKGKLCIVEKTMCVYHLPLAAIILNSF